MVAMDITGTKQRINYKTTPIQLQRPKAFALYVSGFNTMALERIFLPTLWVWAVLGRTAAIRFSSFQLILVWARKEKRVITGADILDRRLKGI